MNLCYKFLCVSLIISAGFGCRKATDPTPSPGAEITVAAYFNADNNLERVIIENLLEFGVQSSSRDVQILVKLDRITDPRGGRDYSKGNYSEAAIFNIPSFSDTKVFYVGEKDLYVLSELGERDMGSSQEINEFFSYALQTYPAKKMVLVIANHGDGERALLQDDTNNESGINIAAVVAGAQAALQASGREKFDVVIFDACLMGSIEVANEVASIAHVMVASEDSSAGRGLDYTYLNQKFHNNPTMDVKEIGIAAVEAYTNSHPDLRKATMTALNLDAVPDLVADLKYIFPHFRALPAAVRDTIERGAHSFPQTANFRASPRKDLQQFLEKMQQVFRSQGNLVAADRAGQALNKYRAAIIKSYVGSSFRGAGGFYLDWSKPLPDQVQASSFAVDTGWDEVVNQEDALLQVPHPYLTISTPVGDYSGNEVSFASSVTGDTAAVQPYILITETVGSYIEILEAQDATFNGSTVSHQVAQNSVHYLTDCPANSSTYCKRSMVVTLNDGPIGNNTVPLLYRGIGSNWCEATATFNSGGKLLSIFSDILCPNTEFYFEIEPSPGDVITPRRDRLDPFSHKLVTYSALVDKLGIPENRILRISDALRLERGDPQANQELRFLINDRFEQLSWSPPTLIPERMFAR